MTVHPRFHVGFGPGSARQAEAHDGFDLVVGALDELDAVEAALTLIASGAPMLVGVDWADVRQATAGAGGLARVVRGIFGVTAALEVARDELVNRGYGDSFLLVQLSSAADWPRYALEGLADLADSLFASVEGPVLYTSASGSAVGSCSVLIGFGSGNGG